MKTTLLTHFILISALVSETLSAQTGSAYGHGALQIFDQRGFAAAPLWFQILVSLMALTFISGLCFIKRHSIARWVVACFVASIVATSISINVLMVTPLFGF